MKPVSIISLQTISAQGVEAESISSKMREKMPCLSFQNGYWAGRLQEGENEELHKIQRDNNKYASVDRTVLMALYVSRMAFKQASWELGSDIGINLGSSRGATETFEVSHKAFLETGTTPPLTSPTTTLGNISSWVANDLGASGPTFSHSITCSTALHGILNGIAWLGSGMCKRFLAGGSEAPLTDFTIAQMRALKIYTKASSSTQFPCRALDLDKKENTMVLGEGAGVICMENGIKENRKGLILGVGYATEKMNHHVSLSDEGICLQKSMKMAMDKAGLISVDAIVMHAPGTIKGDWAEFKAIQKIFQHRMPYVTSNKWKIGHTFGASGIFNVEMALLMLEKQEIFPLPWDFKKEPNKLETILVNAVGFGGNAVSIILSR